MPQRAAPSDLSDCQESGPSIFAGVCATHVTGSRTVCTITTYSCLGTLRSSEGRLQLPTSVGTLALATKPASQPSCQGAWIRMRSTWQLGCTPGGTGNEGQRL